MAHALRLDQARVEPVTAQASSSALVACAQSSSEADELVLLLAVLVARGTAQSRDPPSEAEDGEEELDLRADFLGGLLRACSRCARNRLREKRTFCGQAVNDTALFSASGSRGPARRSAGQLAVRRPRERKIWLCIGRKFMAR